MNRIICFIEALFFHASCSFRAEVSRYYLHFIWWILDPVLNLATLYLVFGVFLATPQPHYALFLLCGLVVWQWFANTVTNSTYSIYGSMRLFQQFKVYPIHFPLCVFLQDFMKYAPVFIIFIASCAVFAPVRPSAVWLNILPVMLVEGLCVLGFSILAASMVPFLPDLAKAVPIIIQMLFFASGIFFDIEKFVLPEHHMILYSNPNAVCIKTTRDIIMEGRAPDWPLVSYAAVISLGALLIGLALVTHFRKVYSRIIEQ